MQRSPREVVAELWERIPREHGGPPVEVPNLEEFLRERGVAESARAAEMLEPWATLSTEVLLWISHLHMSLSESLEASPRSQSLWALTGFLTTQGVAIRKLVLDGLDVQARSLLRSYIEAFMCAVVFLHDEGLAKRYVEAQDSSDVRQLWYQELRSRQLRRRFEAAVGDPAGKELSALRGFTEWFEMENVDYSQSVHASYLAAVMASLPPDVDGGEMARGIFGRATEASIRTLRMLFQATWFFGRFVARGILGLDGAPGSRLRGFDRREHVDGIVITGYYVLEELAELYCETE